jgi:MoaA/NifB/PqqE/SkfB family radical SAM enzyme
MITELSPDTVYSVELGLINKCVLNCRMCLRSEEIGKQLPKDVAVELEPLVTFLDALPNLRQLDLVGSVSEPTLHKQIREIVTYARGRNLQIRVSTNGNTFNERWWASFGELFGPDDIVRFAVDGSTQEIHERYRVGGKLSKVLANHRAFKQHTKARTVLQNILFTYNIDDQENIKALFHAEGFDVCEFTHTGDGDYTGQPSLVTDNVMPVNDLLIRYKERGSPKSSMDTKVVCKSCKDQQLYINHMGCVLPCDDMEETTFVHREQNITIYNNTIEECFAHVNGIIRKRFFARTCKICCGPANQALHIDYPIVQFNRDGKQAILHKFREIGEFE